MTIEERTLIAQGWALLAQGLLDDAQARAAKALEAAPRNPSALVLAVEVAVTRSGAQAGLAVYEKWLEQRMEEPFVVRRIATALLRESVAQSADSSSRLEALRALAADGDANAAAELSTAAAAGGSAERRLLASTGDERALKALIADLKNGTGNAMTTIEALGGSGSKMAIPPLTASLKNPRSEIRGAAVEALGKLGATLGAHELVSEIKPLLQDQSSFVRTKAAGALYALNDMSGLSVLQALLQEEASASRLAAVHAMASHPDPVWLEHVRQLTSANEPEIRIGAARLLAPHDPESARKVLEAAQQDPNPALRGMATDAIGDVQASDLATLRKLMKSNNRSASVRAAARVLAVLR
jgi:hypothetical protein